MLDQVSHDDWIRVRNCIMAVWVGFVFAIGAMATMSAGWGAALLIFVLIAGSFTLNLGRPIFLPASIVIVCFTVLYLSNLWPDTYTMTRLAQFVPVR